MTTEGNPLVWVTEEVKDGVVQGRGLWIWCPGCDEAHRPRAANADGSRPDSGPYWDWNGATDTTFTISPSLLSYGMKRCHSFIKDGQWQFLGDCEHDLAGTTVPMVPLPDWLCRDR